MSRRLLVLLSSLALATTLFIAMLFFFAPITGWYAETVIWAQPSLAQIYVYGEHAHFFLEPGFGEEVLLVNGSSRDYYLPPEYINRGIYLPRLKSGLYYIYAGSLRVLAPRDYLLEGYTITRNGENMHYRFACEEGQLILRVEAVSALPQDVYDIIIDAGHGGNNLGAHARGYEEKEENLRASLYLAELFKAAGLKVACTRYGDYVPGQPGVAEGDINPYVAGGRVDLAYQARAKYMISNHLNASTRAVFRGWQLYRSVLADDSWQQAISAAFIAYGHTPNDNFPSFGPPGIYRRYSRDDPQTNSDYYYILREVGGAMTVPRGFAAAHPQADLRQGAEALLVEYAFLDNRDDMEYWQENWRHLVEAVARGCLKYWGIE